MTLSMAIPVDSDVFLRRECPTCEREFKWLPASEDEESAAGVPDGGYFCPYCGVQAPTGAWFTEASRSLSAMSNLSASIARIWSGTPCGYGHPNSEAGTQV